MKLVRNDFVYMNWDVDGFIEFKGLGFDSAIHVYDGKPVVFHDGRIYIWLNSNDEVAEFSEIVKEIKKAHKAKDLSFPEEYENYIELYDGVDFNEVAIGIYKLEDHKEDMLARNDDLGCYRYVDDSGKVYDEE